MTGYAERIVSDDKSFRIFARNYLRNDSETNPARVKIFSTKIIEDNVLVRNFIPCYCTEAVTNVDGETCEAGTIGLYDIVEGKFYTNQGTGTFLKGADVN